MVTTRLLSPHVIRRRLPSSFDDEPTVPVKFGGLMHEPAQDGMALQCELRAMETPAPRVHAQPPPIPRPTVRRPPLPPPPPPRRARPAQQVVEPTMLVHVPRPWSLRRALTNAASLARDIASDWLASPFAQSIYRAVTNPCRRLRRSWSAPAR